MNKTSIKIIKRKDAGATAEIKTQNTHETRSAAAMRGEKVERSLHRKMAGRVSNWISERRENNRIEQIAAIRKIFANEHLLGQI